MYELLDKFKDYSNIHRYPRSILIYTAVYLREFTVFPQLPLSLANFTTSREGGSTCSPTRYHANKGGSTGAH